MSSGEERGLISRTAAGNRGEERGLISRTASGNRA